MVARTELYDDIDGSPKAVTVKIALDSDVWTIDLSPANRELLEKVLKPFLSQAKQVSGRRRKPKTADVDSRAVRAWALEAGFEISPKGKIPDEIMAKYVAAHNA